MTWVQVHMDTCKLLTGPPVAALAIGEPVPNYTSGCHLPLRLPDGRSDRLELEVGVEFKHGDRVIGAPIVVGGLGGYQLRRDNMYWSGDQDGSECQVDIPLSADRSIRIEAPVFPGLEASCKVARAAAETVATHLRDPASALRDPPPPGPPPPIGFPPGAPDENMDRACQVYVHATAENCRAPRPVEVPKGTTAILKLPREATADVACAMLAPAFQQVSGQQVEAAAFGGRCLGQTVDGTLQSSLAMFAFATMEQYCYSSPRTPITIAGHAGVVCNEAGTPSVRHLIIAAHPDPDVSGVLIAELRLSRPRGTRGDDPEDPQRLRLLDSIVEQVLTRHFD
jgi:hypothetical protein